MAKPGKNIIDLKNSIQLRTAVEGGPYFLYSILPPGNLTGFFIIHTFNHFSRWWGHAIQSEEIWRKLFPTRAEHQARLCRQQPVDPNLWPLRALIGLYRVSSTRAYPRGACRLSNTSLWPRYTKPKTSFVDLIVFFRTKGLSWGSRLYSWTHVDPLYSLLASLTEMFQH